MRRNAAIWTAAVVSAAPMTASGPAGEAATQRGDTGARF
jgi:hypothetical protein